MFKTKLKKTGYKSELDEFFHDFDKKRTVEPQARLVEIEKHQKIAKMRDEVVEEKQSSLWDGF